MKTYFHMKGYAPRLALKKRYKTTWKWHIHAFPSFLEPGQASPDGVCNNECTSKIPMW